MVLTTPGNLVSNTGEKIVCGKILSWRHDQEISLSKHISISRDKLEFKLFGSLDVLVPIIA